MEIDLFYIVKDNNNEKKGSSEYHDALKFNSFFKAEQVIEEKYNKGHSSKDFINLEFVQRRIISNLDRIKKSAIKDLFENDEYIRQCVIDKIDPFLDRYRIEVNAYPFVSINEEEMQCYFKKLLCKGDLDKIKKILYSDYLASELICEQDMRDLVQDLADKMNIEFNAYVN